MRNCRIVKPFYPCIFVLFCFLVIYTTLTLNSCVLGNLKHIIRKHGRNAIDLITADTTEEVVDFKHDKQTLVQVVSLEAVPNLLQNNLTYGGAKYRFLRQQGLLPIRRLPDALIIGVKKGGTRALLEFARLHPDIRAAGSEIHFFDRYYSRGLQWYRRRMPLTLEGQVTMEKTPSYFITKNVPQRVRQMNAATKLVVVLRDPTTRAVSDYTQASSKKTDMKPFEELVFKNGTDGPVDTAWAPVHIGVYSRHVERWLKHFPLKQMLFVSGERMIVDPAAEMVRLQDFLGLKRVVTEKYFYFNTTKGFPCLLKSEGRSTPHCLGKTKGRNHPRIDPTALLRLQQFYQPFNQRLYQLTGINFGWS